MRNVVGAVARGDDFYGRETFVDLLWEKIDAGSVLLVSARRYGKTSVMYRLEDKPRAGWAVAYTDVEHITSPEGLITELTTRIVKHPALYSGIQRAKALPRESPQGLAYDGRGCRAIRCQAQDTRAGA